MSKVTASALALAAIWMQMACGDDAPAQNVASGGAGGAQNSSAVFSGGAASGHSDALALGGSSTTGDTKRVTVRNHRLAVGMDYACLIRREDSGVVCWGTPASQSGQNEAQVGPFRHIAAEISATCGILDSGAVRCWGRPNEIEFVPADVTATDLDVGKSIVCVVGLDSAARCWEAGGGLIELPVAFYVQVAAGSQYACGLTTEGEIKCAGMMNGNPVQPPAGRFSLVSAGTVHACAVRDDHTLACWGLGGPNDVRDGSDSVGASWGQATPPDGEFVSVAVGLVHSCALRPSGEVVCWGAGKTNGTCGAENRDACGMSLAPQGAFVEISLGTSNSCGIRSNGTVECWGSDLGGRSTPPPDAM